MTENKKSETFNTNLGVMLAVAGSAIGFGNFLRFPGLAAQYGGGAFMIAYFCAFLLLGIPISWVEWAVGRRGGSLGAHSTAGIFYRLSGSSLWKYMGVLGVMSTLVHVLHLPGGMDPRLRLAHSHGRFKPEYGGGIRQLLLQLRRTAR